MLFRLQHEHILQSCMSLPKACEPLAWSTSELNFHAVSVHYSKQYFRADTKKIDQNLLIIYCRRNVINNKKTRGSGARFTEKVEEYLSSRFQTSERTGRKADPDLIQGKRLSIAFVYIVGPDSVDWSRSCNVLRQLGIYFPSSCYKNLK